MKQILLEAREKLITLAFKDSEEKAKNDAVEKQLKESAVQRELNRAKEYAQNVYNELPQKISEAVEMRSNLIELIQYTCDSEQSISEYNLGNDILKCTK